MDTSMQLKMAMANERMDQEGQHTPYLNLQKPNQ